MVVFKNVTKKFGNVGALRDISFDVEPGEFVFITGTSGAGKTTILRLILRDILPDSGTIAVSGRDIVSIKGGELPLYRRLVGMVFQDFKLLPDRTIGENVGLALAIRGFDTRERESKVKSVLSQVDLREKFNFFPHQLAGGEIQRAVIARALIGHPKILLADEPTGNLDPDTAWGIIELLEDIRKSGTTVIMATHNKEVVDKKRGHVIQLKGGALIKDKKGSRYADD